jgi:hypothetical protein
MTDATTATDVGWLAPEEMDAARERLPILYVDVVPVRVDVDGTVTAAGLLLRAGADGQIKRALVSGRVLYHERVRAALLRRPVGVPDVEADAPPTVGLPAGPLLADDGPSIAQRATSSTKSHFPRSEGWPVMPVDHAGFTLEPVGSFDRNLALGPRPLACRGRRPRTAPVRIRAARERRGGTAGCCTLLACC